MQQLKHPQSGKNHPVIEPSTGNDKYIMGCGQISSTNTVLLQRKPLKKVTGYVKMTTSQQELMQAATIL